MNGLIRCSGCGRIVPIGTVNMEFVDGVFLCEDCLDAKTFICDHCGERHLVQYAVGVHTEDYNTDTETWCADCADRDAFECEHCGEWFTNDCEHFDVDGETWCGECVESDACWCDECCSYHEPDRGVYIERYDRWVCEDCLNESYSRCSHCDEFVRDNDLYEVRGGDYVCRDCRDGWYSYCNECDEWVRDDDYDFDHNMCSDCYENNQTDEDERCGRTYDGADDTSPRSDNAVVHSYHWGHRRDPVFFGAMHPTWNGLYHHFGLEVEVDGMSGTSPRRQRALNMLDALAGEHLRFEEDCSLRNRGFEIITEPHTEEALYGMPWEAMFDALKENGYSAHDVGTCGLHMHISRTYFGNDAETQDDNIAKLIQFFELYYEDIVKVSRREVNSDGQVYYAQKCGMKSKSRLKLYTKNKASGHYSAVNISNSATVEIRIMRGTLNIKSFLACIDFLITAVKNSCRLGWSDTTDDFEWLRGCKPETLEYIQRRGAFSNAIYTLRTTSAPF